MQQVGRCSYTRERTSVGIKLRVALPLQALVIGCLIVSTGCSLCSSKTLMEIASPNTRDRAFVVESDCGATVDFSRQVTLVHGDKLPKPHWNESIIENGTVFRVSGQPAIQVKWDSDAAITITYRLLSSADRVVKQDSVWDHISVDYAPPVTKGTSRN